MQSENASSEITNSGVPSPSATAGLLGGSARTDPGKRPLRYGLPCANCRLYYAAEFTACPICNCSDRISPAVILLRDSTAAF
jgi:hypothetical protein